MDQIILTIAIPTYNRSKFLDKCLKEICSQDNFSSDKIEIIVSDNNSSDDTADVVAAYSKNHKISYIKNVENLGADLNILQCFEKSKGKYIWIFGDDDFLLPGTLAKILSLLEYNDFGCIHLSALSFSSESEVNLSEPVEMEYTIYENALDYYTKIHYFTTFITGNIINKYAIDKANFYKNVSTNLVQLGWIIPSIFGGKNNIIIDTPSVAVKADNTGGYKLITTFSKNFNIVLKALVDRGIDRKIISITNDNLLESFFPVFIRKKLYEKNNFENESGFKILLESYWSYLKFWKNIFPIYCRFFVKNLIVKLK